MKCGVCGPYLDMNRLKCNINFAKQEREAHDSACTYYNAGKIKKHPENNLLIPAVHQNLSEMFLELQNRPFAHGRPQNIQIYCHILWILLPEFELQVLQQQGHIVLYRKAVVIHVPYSLSR